jgi:hypothetical protein
MKHPWQKNFYKIPLNILSNLDTIRSDDIIVGCVKEISAKDIESGIYNHLGISLNNSLVEFTPKVIPNIQSGRYSKYNVHGRVIRLKHLPKINKDFSVDAPIYGDPSKGYNEITWTKKVWQKQFIFPKEIVLNISLLQEKESTYIFKFTLNMPVLKTDTSFHEDLLFYCNLIQENTGGCNIFEKDTTNEDYINTLYVNWELLPEGIKDTEFLDLVLGKIKNPSPKTIETLKERIEFFNTLDVKSKIFGSNNFSRYFGAILKNDFALFENIKYGNAIYIFKKNWQELSKMSRIDLQRIRTEDIIRIPHSSKWKKNVINNIKEVS